MRGGRERERVKLFIYKGERLTYRSNIWRVGGHGDRHRRRQRDRKVRRQRDKEGNRETDKEGDRETDREGDRETDR